MHEIVQRLILIENQIKEESTKLNIPKLPKIIAISKTFSLESIVPLIEHGHLHFGENKVQESKIKWTNIKREKANLNLHFVGNFQTNKAKDVVKLFDYVHSLENIKQAEVLSKYENELKKKLKYFVQINVGNETQKSGIDVNKVSEFTSSCKKLGLEVIGTMCLPPNDGQSDIYFSKMLDINKILGLNETSMGMSSDYINAINFKATYLRIGSKIFGERN